MIKKIFISIICLIAIGLIGFALYIFMTKDNKDTSTENKVEEKQVKKENKSENLNSDSTTDETSKENSDNATTEEDYDYLNPPEKPENNVKQEDKAAGDSYAENQKMTD